MPFFAPSLAGKSNNTTGTLTFTRCAAICAPITPAPRTATFFTWKRLMVFRLSLLAPGSAWPRSSRSLYIGVLKKRLLHAHPGLGPAEGTERAAHVELPAAVHGRQAQRVFAAVLGVE